MIQRRNVGAFLEGTLDEILLRSEVLLGRLNGGVTEQHFNLVYFAAGRTA